MQLGNPNNIKESRFDIYRIPHWHTLQKCEFYNYTESLDVWQKLEDVNTYNFKTQFKWRNTVIWTENLISYEVSGCSIGDMSQSSTTRL